MLYEHAGLFPELRERFAKVALPHSTLCRLQTAIARFRADGWKIH